MVTARGFCYTAIPNKCISVLMISCSFNFTARHQAGQEPSVFPSIHFAITNCWPGNNKLESLCETSLALRSVCTQTHEEILHTQIVGGFTKRHHPLEAMGGGQHSPFSWGSSFHSSLAHQVAHTKLLQKLMPAPCPTSHCINPSPAQWALGPQRALCCAPLAPGDHSSVLGLAASQNWRVLWAKPHISECWVQHIHQAQHLQTLHLWCWNKTACTFDRNKNSKLIPTAQYYSCFLRNSPKVWALQVINVLFTLRNHITITYTIYINVSFYETCMNAFLYLSLDIKMPIVSSNKMAEVWRLTESSSFKYSKSPQGITKLKNYSALFHQKRKEKVDFLRKGDTQ